jgi:hypothetical protein
MVLDAIADFLVACGAGALPVVEAALVDAPELLI